jgi:hypothetical protein
MVELLSLAHDRACEAELAALLEADLEAGRLPDLAVLMARFAPQLAALPVVTVRFPALSTYDDLTSLNLGDVA